MRTFTYLAIAYSGFEAESFKHSLEAVAIYANAKSVAYSPIAHMHPVAHAYELPRDFPFWKDNAEGMIRGADSLDVIVPSTWEGRTAGSVGVRAEARFAHGLGKPVRVVLLEGGRLLSHPEKDELFAKIIGEM